MQNEVHLKHPDGSPVQQTPNSKTLAEMQQQAQNPVQVPGIPDPATQQKANHPAGVIIEREGDATVKPTAVPNVAKTSKSTKEK